MCNNKLRDVWCLSFFFQQMVPFESYHIVRRRLPVKLGTLCPSAAWRAHTIGAPLHDDSQRKFVEMGVDAPRTASRFPFDFV